MNIDCTILKCGCGHDVFVSLLRSLTKGTLMGITNSLGTIPGFLGPSVVGALTNGNVSRLN